MWFAQTADPTLYTVQTTTVTTTNKGFWAAFGVYMFVMLVIYILLIVARWKIFTKAGEAGWKSIIPFYAEYTLFRIAGRNGWGFLLLIIPFVNIVVAIVVMIDLAKHFGKSTLFGVVGLVIFSVIGYFILGFGDAQYVGPKHD